LFRSSQNTHAFNWLDNLLDWRKRKVIVVPLAGQRLKGRELGKNIVDRLGVIGSFLFDPVMAVAIFLKLFGGLFCVVGKCLAVGGFRWVAAR
jgi:hypothetical protein